MNNIKYEYRPSTKRSGLPRLLPRDEITNRQGYISVYGFDEEAEVLIKEHRGTWGLRNTRLYSDILYIDIDDDEAVAQDVFHKLYNMGREFKYFSSGSPHSYHFHVSIEPMYDVGINYIQKQWVMENIKGADLSIYKTSGVIRIDGSFHKKHPGCRKHMISHIYGEVLDLNKYSVRMDIEIPAVITKHTVQELEHLESVFNNLLFRNAGEGERNNEIFRRAILAKDIGLEFEEALDKLSVWNDYYVYPMVNQSEIISTLKSAYRMV